MKKLLPYGLLLILAITFFACGKKDNNIDTPNETETDMQAEFESDVSASKRKSETQQTTESTLDTAVVTPRVEIASSLESEIESGSDLQMEIGTETTPPAEPESTESSNSSDTEPRTGITFNEDGSVTVGHDTISQLLEEEADLIDAMGLTDEELDALIGDGDVTISTELQKKLLEYLGTLPLTEQMRILGKFSELMNNS